MLFLSPNLQGCHSMFWGCPYGFARFKDLQFSSLERLKFWVWKSQARISNRTSDVPQNKRTTYLIGWICSHRDFSYFPFIPFVSTFTPKSSPGDDISSANIYVQLSNISPIHMIPELKATSCSSWISRTNKLCFVTLSSWGGGLCVHVEALEEEDK